jgi:hypothetical protein
MVEGPNGEEIIWQDGAYDTPTIKLEDARLMAAAPDLLEALKNCMEWMEDLRTSGDAGNWEWGSDQYTQAMTVIAKATGEKNGN